MRNPLAILAALFDRLGRHEPAATIAGFGFSPLNAAAFPEITPVTAHLRDVLGDETYESLARNGETMTSAAMATYAYEQIDQARAERHGQCAHRKHDRAAAVGGDKAVMHAAAAAWHRACREAAERVAF